MSKIPDTAVCQFCQGTGKRHLTRGFDEVCKKLLSGPLNAGELASKLKISTSAALNRLLRLEGQGLVERRYFSRTAQWYLVEKDQTDA